LEQGAVDLVLLDLMMPEMDGFAVLEAMREREATRNTPVIVVTGQVLTEAEMAATPISTLEKMEQSLRGADYSGRGGFAANSSEECEPLLPPAGILG
jgi:CheY-like chemotaxis protein